MSINKVVYAGAVLLDLTGDTINEDVIIDGYTGHDKAGNLVTGKLKIITVDEALDANSTNPVENKAIVAALNGKLSTSGTASKATADANGNVITATYETKGNAIVGLSISGKTITYTKGNGNSGTITTQDTTYTAMTASEATTGTATAARSITAKVLNDKINEVVTAKAYSHPASHPASMITGLATVATTGSYTDLSNKPTSLPANGGNAATVGGFTVGVNVPADAKFTDTVYTLPNATASVLGGVKVGTNISVSSGTISVADGSTSAKGVVQLSSAVNSTSTTLAATASAVKSAYDLANGKQSPATTLAGYGITNAYTKTEVDNAIANNKYSLPTASTTLGGVKTTSTVTSTSGLTACPIIDGVPYYKDTNNQYTLSSFSITATAAELNVLDGITATTAELNYCDGVTSNIQTQLNGKLSTSGTAAKATADASGNNIANTYAKKATTLSGYGIPSVTWGQLKGS